MVKPVVTLIALIILSLTSGCSHFVEQIDTLGNARISIPRSSIPQIENEWTLKSTVVTEKSVDDSYQMLYKFWEYDGAEGLTLSVIFQGHESYIARAWKKHGIVHSAVQPEDGEWTMIRFSAKEFDITLGYMENPTEIVSVPGGVALSFTGADGNEVQVDIIFDPRILPE